MPSLINLIAIRHFNSCLAPYIRLVIALVLTAGILFLAFSRSATRVVEAAPPPASLSALFVVGSTTLSAGDNAVKARLEGLGLTVVVKDAVTAATVDANDKGLIVISESVTSGNVNTKFRDVPVPVVVMEAALFDDMLMVGPTLAVDYENQTNQTQVRINDTAHAMAANLTGSVTIATAPSALAWGLPSSSAIKIASLTGFPSRYALYGYEAGATMVGMTAPARRAGVFLLHGTAPSLNHKGWALFDAAIRWSANLSPFSMYSSALFVVGSTTLSAGDAAIKTRLEELGLTVTVKDAVSAVTADANDKGLVVISESVASGNVNTKFRDVATPVIVLEAALYDDMSLTGATLGTDYENQTNQTQVTITNAIHQMAANLSGTVTITTASSALAWGVPSASAVKVAALVNFPARYAVYGYETGAAMVGMNAPARRVGLFPIRDTVPNLNGSGWALFDAAVRWCANRGVNVALSVNGAAATSSSSFSLGYLEGGSINGDANGMNWGFGGGWMDGSNSDFPDWVQVDFQGTRTISEIDVFTVQDTPSSPAQPTEHMTFASYGATNYSVQYWKDNSWWVVPYGSVTGNNKVWRRFTFSNIRTNKIRVSVNDSADHAYSRIVEVEAWQSQANQTPFANAAGPYYGTTGSPILFNGTASLDQDGSIAGYEWNFGDGTTGTGPTTTHAYSSSGTYNVTLNVTDDAGSTSSVTTTATIALANQPPVANAGGPYLAPKNTSVQLNGTASFDLDGTISSYQWNFGDGTTGTGATPTHTYTTANTFTATLTVTDNSGAPNYSSVEVVVAEPDPNVSTTKIFPGNVSIYTGTNTLFTAASYDTNNAPIPGVNYVWQTNYLGNDARVRISQAGEFIAEIPGTYTVSAQGRGHKAQVTVTVVERPPQCSENCPENLGSEPDPARWRGDNYPSGLDPDNTRGNPPARSPEANGNFQLSIPIVSLAGRGTDLDLQLRYNSRLWNKSGSQITFNIDKDWPAPGWSLGFGKMIHMPENGTFLVEADGTRHSFKGDLTRQQWKYTFVGETTDGSFIKYRVETDRDIHTGNFSSPRATVKYPNGITIIFQSATAVYPNDTFVLYPTLIVDHNGNKITLSYQWGGTVEAQRITTIKDSRGRILDFHYDPSGLLTSITAAGLKDANGQTTVRTLVRLHYRSHTLPANLFSEITPIAPATPFSVIDAVYFPSNRNGYWFGDTDSYSPYGMIRKVVMQRDMGFSTVSSDPVQSLKEQGTIVAGTMTAQQVYSYPQSAQSLTTGPTFQTLTETWYGMDTAPAVTAYAVNNAANPRIITITLPDNTQLVRYAHNYSALANTDPLKLLDGRVYQEEFKDASGNVLRRSTTNWENGYLDNPRVTRSETTEFANGQTLSTAVEYGYDNGTYNQITEIREYGFGNLLLRTTNATYAIKNDRDISQYDFYYEYAPRQLYLPASIEVRSAAGVRVALEQYGYDQNELENVYGRPKIPHMQVFGPNGWTYGVVQHAEEFDVYLGAGGGGTPGPLPNKIMDRGNVTTVTRYTNAAAATGPIVDQFYYDITGNVVLKTAAGISQKFSFIEETQNAYPASTSVGSLTDPTAQVITSADYDVNTGFVLKQKNANGLETTRSYFPNSWRAKETISATGAWTSFEYDDVGLTTTQTIRSSLNGPIASKIVDYFNGIGKVYRRQELAALGSGGASDVWNTIDSKYDKFGRLAQESRPYAAGQTPQFTTRTYDVVGRVSAIADPRGSGSTFVYNDDSIRPDGASTILGETVMARDAWDRWRWARFDGSGQLVEVVEPNPAGGNGFQTLYTYDTLGNLIRIEQGSQVRRFAYDSLGRLIHQKLAEASATLNGAGAKATSEPEDQRWSTVFTYDDRSNLISHIDARAVKTTFSYSIAGNLDPLNRLQSVSYDTSLVESPLVVMPSATVTYLYRTKTATELIDITQVREVQVANVSTEVYDYDTSGRIHEKRLTLNGRPSPMTITYNYDTLNRLNQITYPQQYQDGVSNPMRKAVTHNYDLVGRVDNLRVNNVDYASQINYNAESQVTSFKVGTGSNQLTENYSYDLISGLVTSQSVTRGGTTLMSLSYAYHRGLCEMPGAVCDGSPSAFYTTGQVTLTSNALTGKRQHFSYDDLGRLKMTDHGIWVEPEYPQVPYFRTDWKEEYSYDRFGNRTGVIASNNSGVSPVPQDGLASLSYDASSNRINLQGFTYDPAGNQLQNGTGQSFTYDAAGRLARVKDQSGNTVESYTYGSSRRRLITQHGNESSTSKTFYVWAGESVITEYVEPSGGATMPKWSKNYIYFGKGLLATEEPNTSGGELVRYHHPDRLGTRLVTNNADTTSFQQTNLPFGTALEATSTTNRRFTSYDRSGVSLLDYAVNRNYDSQQGRFTQVDPIGMQATDLLNPQSLNLYAYCANDPVNSIDSLGTWGYSISFGIGGPGLPGSGGGGGGLLGGLLNFGVGLLGSIFGGGGERHIIGSPFVSMPPGRPLPPLPGPMHSSISASAPQDRVQLATDIGPLQRGLANLDKFGALMTKLTGGGKITVYTTAVQAALGELFGNVFFNAGGLNPTEIQFAAEVSAFENRSFQGGRPNDPGIDGFLHDGRTLTSNLRPIQLQQNNTGGMNRIRDDASEHEGKAEKAGYKKMALYIKYTGSDVGVVDVLRYLGADGEDLGISGITNRPFITEITIFVPDGVVRIDSGKITLQSKKR